MARPTRKAPASGFQPSASKKNKGKHKEAKQPVSVKTKPPPPVEISKEDKDDEESLEAEVDDDDEEGGSDDENGDSEDEGVDQVGMERLVELLGEDGLDDFDRAQLKSLAEDDEEEEDLEDGAEDEKVEEVSDREEGKNGGDMEEKEEVEVQSNDDDVLLDEAESIDQDAVPKQKLEIDNQVSLVSFECLFLILYHRLHSTVFVKRSNSTLHCLGQKLSPSHTLKKFKSMSMTISIVNLRCAPHLDLHE